ncbi:MAG: hypothetical protein ACKN82_15505, partial [Pirellula sp.]
MVFLHWDKDGLFFQGDSPRHAMNGIFWGDLIREGLTNPIEYTKSYYARYPAITPTRYLPVFYFFEAIAFELFGQSAFVAKGLVQCFAFVAGLYLLAAMRRWISLESGIFAGLLFLTPGMLRWSNAVMLNVPALTFATASLYHFRDAIDATDQGECTNQIRRSLLFWFLAIGTHPLIGVVVLVGLAWLTAAGKLSFLIKKPMVFFIVGSLLALMGLIVCIAFISGEQVAQARVNIYSFISPYKLLYYPTALPGILGWMYLILGAGGIFLSLSTGKLRPDAIKIVIAAFIIYLALTPIWALDSRYILVACPAIVYSIGMGFDCIATNFAMRIRPQMQRSITILGFT